MFISPEAVDHKGTKVILTCKCHFCNEITKITVSEWGWKKRLGGELIQRCFPDLKPELREMLVSGMCPKYWNKTFPNA